MHKINLMPKRKRGKERKKALALRISAAKKLYKSLSK